MTDPHDGPAVLAALEAVAARAAVAARLEPQSGQALLRSITEAAVIVFGAEAASIALHEPDTDQLVFRVAAGPQGRAPWVSPSPRARGSRATCSRPGSRSR